MNEMKRFLITVTTYWCGMDRTYPAEAETEEELYDLADGLAYENFNDFCLLDEVAEDQGYSLNDMTEEEWDEFTSSVDESQYYGYHIDEFTGTENEWNNYVADESIYRP